MTRRQLAIATLLTLLCYACGAAVFVDAGSLIAQTTRQVAPGSTPAQILGWLLTALCLYNLALGSLIAMGKAGRIFPVPPFQLNLRIPIPWYYSFCLVPSVLGICFTLATGEQEWGALLVWSSIPTTMIFFLLALGASQEQNS